MWVYCVTVCSAVAVIWKCEKSCFTVTSASYILLCATQSKALELLPSGSWGEIVCQLPFLWCRMKNVPNIYINIGSSAQSKVHKDLDEWVMMWRNLTGLHRDWTHVFLAAFPESSWAWEGKHPSTSGNIVYHYLKWTISCCTNSCIGKTVFIIKLYMYIVSVRV